MHLKKIILENFRQFYGLQELAISSDAEKNVTLIHAENGVGKTALLNAILWCFYRTTTERFEQPEEIVSNQAIDEGNYQAQVEVFFENEGCEYLVRRTWNQHSEEETFDAILINNGNYEPLPAPATFVGSVVPQEMAGYFFFDGEYAENFASQSNRKNVQNAVEDMLGCRTAMRAVTDLLSLKKEFERQIANQARGNMAEQYQKNIDLWETRKEETESKLKMLNDNRDSAEAAASAIIEALRGAEGAKSIQERRDNAEKELKKLMAEKKKADADLVSWINVGGLGLLSSKLTDAANHIFEEAKVQGKIPSYIADTFVQDILAKRICICGRPFEDHSAEAKSIYDLLEDAGNAVATDRLMNARTLSRILQNNENDATGVLDATRKRLEGLGAEIGVLEAIVNECREQLKASDVREIAEKETALENKLNEINELGREIGRLEFESTDLQKKIADEVVKRDRVLRNDERVKGLHKRCKLISATISKIEAELEAYRAVSREKIALQVNNILSETARRNYKASLDEKFVLSMYYEGTDRTVGKSSGENQLLSLAFIASLIRFSRDRMRDENSILKPGTSAPLVLDSPFGQLDPTYQQATAAFLPQMAEQVILMVSKAQGNKEVMQNLQSRIGKEYLLVSENSSSQGGKSSDPIVLHGHEYPTSIFGCDRDMTRIQEVTV